MPESENLLESLVERCLDAGEDYHAEIERQAVAHPEVADDLRRRIVQLEQLGFLGATTPATTTQWLPDRVGGYRLDGLLGRGGMGVVFRAHRDGGDAVALKIVRPDLLADSRAHERFRREAMLAARLSHPGICPVLEVGIDDDVPFLVMPLLQGLTFGNWLRAARPARDRVLAVVEGHARALHAAHEAGLVHRDVTPGNLFVAEGDHAIVLDFGLARDTTGDVATMTMSQEQLGTLPYMSPEQIRAGAIDCRTDVYALGVVLYEAIANRLPFAARNRSDISRLILSGDAPRLGRVATDVSRGLERVVQKAMDLDPLRRYATAQELADDLAREQRGEPVAAHGIGPLVRSRRWVMHHPVAATVILLLTAMLAVATGFVVQMSSLMRSQDATGQALLSRTLEQADPMAAMERGLASYDLAPSPSAWGQLHRLLHQVNVLSTRSVLTGPVRSLTTHRIDDSKDLVAVASESGITLLRLDRRSGVMQEMTRMPVPDQYLLRCVRFSPAGQFVACGGTGKMAFVARVGQGTWRQLSGSNGEVWSVEVDDDGSVFGIDVKGRLLRWAAGTTDADAEPMLDLPGAALFPDHESNLRGMLVGPGGDLLLWNMDYALRVRRDGSLVWPLPPIGSEDRQATAAIDARRERVVMVQQGTVRVLEWSTGKVLWRVRLSSPATCAAVANDGVVASLHVDGTLRFWGPAGNFITEYRDAQDHIGMVHAAPGVDAFLALGFGGTKVRVDTAGKARRTMGGGDIERLGLPGQLAWSSDGSILLVDGGPGQVRSWDFDGCRGPEQTRLVSSPPVGLCVHPDRQQVLVFTHDEKAWSWRPGNTPIELGNLPFDYVSRSLAAPGEPVLVGGRRGMVPRLAVFDEERGSFRVPFKHGGQYSVVGMARLGQTHVLIALGDNRFAASKLQVFRAEGALTPFDQARCRSWDVPLTTGRLTCMDASADGRRLVLGCTTGGLHVWELPDQDWDAPGDDRPPVPTSLSAPANGRVWSADISADGRFVVAGIQDGSVLAWDLDRAAPTVLAEPRTRAARASLADDDRLVIEFAPDGLVRLWDARVEPAALLFEAMVGDGAVVRDAVLLPGIAAAGTDSPEARAAWRLVTVSSDGWLRSWSLDEESVVVQTRQRLQALKPN